MSKSTTDELVKAISTKKKKTKSTPWYQVVGVTVWESRPINWLAIGLAYTSIAFTAYHVAKVRVAIPEFNGIIAFVTTFVVGSRAFKK